MLDLPNNIAIPKPATAVKSSSEAVLPLSMAALQIKGMNGW